MGGHSRVLLGCLALGQVVDSKLVLPKAPPKGFNTFDDYHSQTLNESTVRGLADAMANQLLEVGYEYLVLDGGWSKSTNATGGVTEHLDAWGRPVAAPERYQDMRALSNYVKSRGLKFGLWTIRGIHEEAANRKLPVKGMEHFTLDELVDQENTGGGPNGSCLWAKEWLGVNMSHPAAEAYYASRVDLLVDDYGVDFIKADCMMCAPYKFRRPPFLLRGNHHRE